MTARQMERTCSAMIEQPRFPIQGSVARRTIRRAFLIKLLRVIVGVARNAFPFQLEELHFRHRSS
jgi:hypothetical protein